jgi:AraC-like DNA-binding protein
MSQTTTNKIVNWQVEGCHFWRFDISPDKPVVLDKIFHDDIVIIGFSGAVWNSHQNGQHYLETPNCLVMRDAGQIFSLESAHISQTGATCREIKISTQQLKEVVQKYEIKPYALDFKNPIIDNLALRNQFAYTHKMLESSDCMLEKTSYLAVLFNNFIHYVAANQHSYQHQISPSKVKVAIEHLRNAYSNTISLTELSEITDTNPFVLLRNFRKSTGITPHEYLQAYRIIQARKLISTGISLADVAMLCGFSDQSHLTRVFKRKVGVTPGQFLSM